MSACTLVLCADYAAELSHTESVHAIGLKGSVTAALQTDVGLAAILIHLSCNDVHYAAHGIAAVQQAGRATNHFHLLGHHCLVGIRDGMSHQTCILGLSVYQYQQLCTAAYATYFQVACRASANAIAQDSFAGREETRCLLHNGWQDGRAIVLVEFLVVNTGNGKGQVTCICGIACTSDHYFVY